MKKLLTLFCVFACFFVQAVYASGQSQGNSSGSSGTPKPGGATNQNPLGLAGHALSNMDNTFSSLDEEEITPQDAYFLGRAVAANILSVYKPYTQNQELTRYLNRICQTIAINSPQPEMFNGYHVIVLDSNEFNAFASPGGHILITKKLVDAAASEEMLAAVIAHEFAHILLQHGVNLVAEMRLNDALNATADRAAGIAARESKEAARAVLFRSSVTKLADAMMKSGYAQPQEFEADATAITLLAAAGYNPGAMVEMLKILQQTQGSQRGGFNSTHPSPAQRLANAERMNNRYRVQDTSSYRLPRFKRTLAR
ncbi:MAG: M48 family metalloprotease [Treponema sp.]|jgi:predicted Zn-dependent protease|nr:M48 family metalloprotease [Treponema sp.]